MVEEALESIALGPAGPQAGAGEATPAGATADPEPVPVASGGSKELLLRLLQSEHFVAWIGLNYLWKYSSARDVGLQYFICEQLKRRPLAEIEFILPQIW